MTTITAITYFSNQTVLQRAISLARALVLMERPDAIIPPDAGILEVRCPSRVVLVPDQIIFNVDRAFIPRVPPPTKRGIYSRDRGLCAYCGRPVPFGAATLDHVHPRSQGGPSSWENLVLACERCNGRKADRTPEQANMALQFRPCAPRRARLRNTD